MLGDTAGTDEQTQALRVDVTMLDLNTGVPLVTCLDDSQYDRIARSQMEAAALIYAANRNKTNTPPS